MMNVYRTEADQPVCLKDFNPRDHSEFPGRKEEAVLRLASLKEQLGELQNRLYAQNRYAVLIVLQGMDTSGKDGTIRNLFDGVSPQGLRVANFRAPSEEERNHHYLWRVQRQLPGRGEIVLFNRSHYEAVLAERVLEIVSPDVWSERFEQINSFEETLAAEETVILKFFLHISRGEQRKRLLERRNNPEKHWKLGMDDIVSHHRWDDYTTAYEEMLSRTSTQHAPWFVVPSDRKWYRNLVVSSIVVDTLQSLHLQYPAASIDLDGWSLD